ncbi:DUF6517 family protein [Halohasta salina]|uniref:DUF6517 family protein n=1 Tax=Halohasta salina TaxID=2961621 RepID=UPI0020A409F8|nr:DUF6517 family protein [Halohasta salina]
MNRRSLLAGAAAAGTVGLAGCLGGLLATTNSESTPAGVSESVLAATDYELAGIEQRTTEETVAFAGQSETVTVSNYLTTYERRVGIEGVAETTTARFAVFSTPKLAVFGRPLNPVAEQSTRELVGLVEAADDSIDDPEHDADETVTVLDQQATKSRFAATTDVGGFPIELDVHVTEAVERGDDFVVTFAVYPRSFREIEADNVTALAESVSVEPPTTNESATDDPANESTTDQ